MTREQCGTKAGLTKHAEAGDLRDYVAENILEVADHITIQLSLVSLLAGYLPEGGFSQPWLSVAKTSARLPDNVFVKQDLLQSSQHSELSKPLK